LSPFQASATIVNLLLATGPFSYPQGFVLLGPVISSILLIFTCFIAYITSTFMIEAISIAHAKQVKKNMDPRPRLESIFDSTLYKSPIVHRNLFLKDMNDKNSPYYIRKKIEIGVVAMEVANK